MAEQKTYPPGTVFPVGGKPHLGTMCEYRSASRHHGQGRSRTVLCYEHGLYRLRRPDGVLYMCQCADGLVPVVICQKHLKKFLAGFAAPGLNAERITDEA